MVGRSLSSPPPRPGGTEEVPWVSEQRLPGSPSSSPSAPAARRRPPAKATRSTVAGSACSRSPTTSTAAPAATSAGSGRSARPGSAWSRARPDCWPAGAPASIRRPTRPGAVPAATAPVRTPVRPAPPGQACVDGACALRCDPVVLDLDTPFSTALPPFASRPGQQAPTSPVGLDHPAPSDQRLLAEPGARRGREPVRHGALPAPGGAGLAGRRRLGAGRGRDRGDRPGPEADHARRAPVRRDDPARGPVPRPLLRHLALLGGRRDHDRPAGAGGALRHRRLRRQPPADAPSRHLHLRERERLDHAGSGDRRPLRPRARRRQHLDALCLLPGELRLDLEQHGGVLHLRRHAPGGARAGADRRRRPRRPRGRDPSWRDARGFHRL